MTLSVAVESMSTDRAAVELERVGVSIPREGQVLQPVRDVSIKVARGETLCIIGESGSGKSLTMVWLAKWIREHQTDARVLLITDRTELDDQIEQVFNGVNESIYRTSSGIDLLDTLHKSTEWLICSLVHKFRGSASEGEAAEGDFIKELSTNMPKDFAAKGNLFVFVDEAHRTQSGKMHDAMKQLLPGAMFIGFTGTPLLKADKATSMETFGSFIHTYKFDEAVQDGVVLYLRYEARNIDQHLTSPAQVEHDPVLHGLVELVCVNKAAEGFDARGLVGLQQWRAGEADEHGAR